MHNSTRPVRTLLGLLIIAALAIAPAHADTLHVPGDYATIQAAVDAAVNGDVVEIADGVYTGAGNKNLDFGGKAITVRSAAGDPTFCIIDCEDGGVAGGAAILTFEHQCTADLNGNGEIDLSDLGELLSVYGTSCK